VISQPTVGLIAGSQREGLSAIAISMIAMPEHSLKTSSLASALLHAGYVLERSIWLTKY
jgi:hypothetical protein